MKTGLSRSKTIFIVLTLAFAFLIVYGLVEQPGYTDAFYHFNAANRLVSGDGLTDPYLWTYVAAPDNLPAPSHLYWMPLTSLVSAIGMALFNAPGSYAAAQFPLALMLWGTSILAYHLGLRLGDGRRHAWVAGLLTLFSGFFTRFWGATDTFAPYVFTGALCMLWMGLGMTAESPRRRHTYWLLAGVFAGLAHLTRADGVLFVLVGLAVMFWPGELLRQKVSRQRFLWAVLLVVGYLLVMTPWFVRNLNVVGTLLPVGGTQSIWFTRYDDLFNYPVDSNPATFFADGLGLLLSSRWDALVTNGIRFIAEEGLVVLAPLMLIGLWVRRRDPFLRGFWIYALGMHLAMTFVFTFPGVRGGQFHSAAALIPWWAALGAAGLDNVVDWVAARRRTWNPGIAKPLFSVMLVFLAVYLSLSISLQSRTMAGTPSSYQKLAAIIPAGSRVMINDPAALYYFTGLGGVVLPNEAADVIPEIANRYDIDYLVVENVTDDGRIRANPFRLVFNADAPPDFLILVDEFSVNGMRLYQIQHEGNEP